jgi:hypothetical protein
MSYDYLCSVRGIGNQFNLCVHSLINILGCEPLVNYRRMGICPGSAALASQSETMGWR